MNDCVGFCLSEDAYASKFSFVCVCLCLSLLFVIMHVFVLVSAWDFNMRVCVCQSVCPWVCVFASVCVFYLTPAFEWVCAVDWCEWEKGSLCLCLMDKLSF